MFANETYHWKQMLEGDQNAFLKIYNLHYHSLFRYGFYLSKDKELTKDCIQEMFMELWKKGSVANKDVQDVKCYLFTWLRRKISKAITQSNKQKARESAACLAGNAEPPYEELLVAFQNTEWEKEKLRRALKNLTKKQLEIIKMRYFDNLSYEQIACKTSNTNRTVYNTVYEALRKLRAKVNVPA